MEAKADNFGISKEVSVKFAGDLDLFNANFEYLKNNIDNILMLQLLREEEMTEEEKAAQKAKPVATNPIPGTPW